jgi:hypothetical protein
VKTLDELVGTNLPVQPEDLGCVAVIDDGDFFGMATGFPQPAEYCELEVVPGHSYCEMHLDDHAVEWVPDPYEKVD